MENIHYTKKPNKFEGQDRLLPFKLYGRVVKWPSALRDRTPGEPSALRDRTPGGYHNSMNYFYILQSQIDDSLIFWKYDRFKK